MGEIVTVNFDKLKDKIEEHKWKAKIRFQKGKEWAVKNKEALILLAPIYIKGVTTVVKVVGKNVNLRKEESVKNLYCYDRSLGHYWALRRESFPIGNGLKSIREKETENDLLIFSPNCEY